MAEKKTQMAKKKKFFSKKKKFFSEKLDQEQPSTFSVSTFLKIKIYQLKTKLNYLIKLYQKNPRTFLELSAGGTILKGVLKVGDKISIRPGLITKN